MTEYATNGRIPDPSQCLDCETPTHASSLCSPCASARYATELEAFWRRAMEASVDE